MFCKHKWKVLSETTTESQIEQISRICNTWESGNLKLIMLQKKHIQIVTCEKCGDLKRFVENI